MISLGSKRGNVAMGMWAVTWLRRASNAKSTPRRPDEWVSF